MKLGIAYNVFDGAEHLKNSIELVSLCADFICIVAQDVSNFGEPAPAWTKELVEEAGLMVDHVVYVKPIKAGGHNNELWKRNIGRSACLDAGCTHFMTMDADEYYVPEQLEAAKRAVEKGGYDSSSCQMQTYYGDPEHALDPPEDYHVPLIYRMDNREFEMGVKFPVNADPTRKMQPGKFVAFERDKIEMHHFSYLRKDIRLKLRNSSASSNFKDRIEKISEYYDSWEPGKDALLAGRGERFYNLRGVENQFFIQWEKK